MPCALCAKAESKFKLYVFFSVYRVYRNGTVCERECVCVCMQDDDKTCINLYRACCLVRTYVSVRGGGAAAGAVDGDRGGGAVDS